MAGLTREGFLPETLEDIQNRIKTRLENFSPGIDLTTESPDGQLVEIFSFELFQTWTQLLNVYNSYNPLVATGQALRNIGFITGLPFGQATRSIANIDLTGTDGTLVPARSIVEDSDGNQFVTEFDTNIPATVQVTCLTTGPIPVPSGTINTIVSQINGWTGINQPSDGIEGQVAQTDAQYRNIRNITVQRNFTGVVDVIEARLTELGVGQVTILNNDETTPASDGTPAHAIHVTIGDIGSVTNEQIAQVILDTKGVGCETFGSTSVVIEDNQKYPHTIKFSKATAVAIYVDITVTFLDSDTAGAEEAIKEDVAAEINALEAGEDVIWSRLFTPITNHAKAQVDLLEIGTSANPTGQVNIPIASDEFASSTVANITITVN